MAVAPIKAIVGRTKYLPEIAGAGKRAFVDTVFGAAIVVAKERKDRRRHCFKSPSAPGQFLLGAAIAQIATVDNQIRTDLIYQFAQIPGQHFSATAALFLPFHMGIGYLC